MEPVKLPVAASFPFTAHHPVYGTKTAKTPEEATELFKGDPTDWFATAAEADAARTQREAEVVVDNRRQNRLRHELGEDKPVSDKIVENSVQADTRIRAGEPEP